MTKRKKQKTCEGTGKVLWFNVAKGYGEIKSDDGTTIFLYGSVLGGDVYGLNIPKRNLVESDDRVEFTAQLNDRPIFPTSPELVWSAVSCKRIGKKKCKKPEVPTALIKRMIAAVGGGVEKGDYWDVHKLVSAKFVKPCVLEILIDSCGVISPIILDFNLGNLTVAYEKENFYTAKFKKVFQKKCYCCSPLSELNTFKGILEPCPICKILLDENNGYNPEERNSKTVAGLTATECETIKEFIQKYPEEFGAIYKGKIYVDC